LAGSENGMLLIGIEIEFCLGRDPRMGFPIQEPVERGRLRSVSGSSPLDIVDHMCSTCPCAAPDESLPGPSRMPGEDLRTALSVPVFLPKETRRLPAFPAFPGWNW